MTTDRTAVSEEKYRKIMTEFEAGTLKTSSGKIVTSRAQAMAIANSEAANYE